MGNILNTVNLLKSTSSKNDKLEILKQVEQDSIEDLVLRFLFDDNIKTGIKRAKLNKHIHLEFDINQPYCGGFEELFEYLSESNTGKEDDIKYIVNSAKLAKNTFGKEFEELIYSVICKDLKLGCSASTYNKAHPENPVFHYDTMGGKAWEDDRAIKILKSGDVIYLTEKIDGNKATRDKYTNEALVSRNGKVWKGTHTILEELNRLTDANRVPEGELVYNDVSGTMTSQQIRSKTTSIMSGKKILDKAEAGIVFKIFEYPLKEDYDDEDGGETYEQRRCEMDKLVNKIEELGLKYIQVIPVEFTITKISEVSDVITKTKKEYIDKGKEGLMAIASSRTYKMGKSSYQMMKLKNVLSADLRISGWNYGSEKGKWEGKFASFTVDFPHVDEKGNKGIYQVDVGMGYTDELREEVNKDPDSYVGRLIEILATEVSKNKQGGYSLSYARLVEFRDDKDTIDLEEHSLVEIDGEFYFKKDKEE